MKIRTAPDDPTSWICVCGNTPRSQGFYPCNARGEDVEPTPEEWTTDWYVCDRCGRIIDLVTLDVMGEREQKNVTGSVDRAA